MELVFHVKFLTLLDFHRIEFFYIFWAKGTNAHFGPFSYPIIILVI